MNAFGISVAPDGFQRITDENLGGFEGVNAIVNDILILGSSYDVNVDGKLLTRNRVETTKAIYRTC